MADIHVNATIQQRSDYSYNWTDKNPILEQGEIGVEIDMGKVKVGDGSLTWNQLSYLTGGVSKKELVDAIYPIGSIKISATPENPADRLGGVWERWGQGKFLVGVDDADEDFNEAEKMGGEKEHTLTIEEIPSHTHGYVIEGQGTSTASGNKDEELSPGEQHRETEATGGGKAHNNLPPFIACYLWKRVG